MRGSWRYLLVALLFVGVALLSSRAPEDPLVGVPARTSPGEEPLPSGLPAVVVDEDLPDRFPGILDPWTGDFDGMVGRRVIRALVVFSNMLYFVDGAEQMGISYEALQRFEDTVNQTLETRGSKLHVVVIPVSREGLIPALVGGRGDIAAANLAVTLEHSKQVDFSDPFLTRVSEVVVTGPGAPPIKSLDDLAGRQIPVRASSSQYESLRLLSRLLEVRGKRRVRMTLVDEYLEDEDLLEMTNAGLVPIVVVDSHKAEFWAQIFDGITVHNDVAVASRGEIAWAFRKDSPRLAAVINTFVDRYELGSSLRDTRLLEHLRRMKWVESSLSDEGLDRLRDTIALFREYAVEYDFEWPLLAALAYEESRLDPSLRRAAGATGIMQITPFTAAHPDVNIPNIVNLKNNIRAGTKYLRFLRDRCFDADEMDLLNKNLFAVASYRAGAEHVAGLRRKAAEAGLDPNLWFQNVEVVAAREMGLEMAQYVSRVAKYYTAYRRMRESSFYRP